MAITKKCVFFSLLILLINSKLSGQSINMEINSLTGTKGQLPFWLWANQLGRYNQYDTAELNARFSGFYENKVSGTDFSYNVGTDLDALTTDKTKLHFTQLYGTANWKCLSMQIGAFAEKEVYGGLSTTNGNLSASRNASPHPRIRLGFNKFIPLNDWLSIYGFYEEGLLNDNRYVKDTHLHRKALYLRIGGPSTVEFTGGIEDFVMWGGTSPVYGELQGWNEYYRYVLGCAGDKNSLKTDQDNVIGNGYGSYQLELRKIWKNAKTTFYLSHPFNDHSGMELANYVDNLYGMFIEMNGKTPLVKNIVVEYIYTKNQSGKYLDNDDPTGKQRRGRDDYYNHGIYQSGATYRQMAMCSPLFGPVIIQNGISMGFDNTRISGFHVAANGFFNSNLQWEAKITRTNNYGKFDGKGGTSYNPPRKFLATIATLKYKVHKLPLFTSLSLAIDRGSLFDEGESTTRSGGMLSLSYQFKN